MDTNEIVTNEEVIEVTEEIANVDSGKGFKVAVGVGLGVLGGVIAYKYIIKPMLAKIKAKKEKQKIDSEVEKIEDVDVKESDETK